MTVEASDGVPPLIRLVNVQFDYPSAAPAATPLLQSFNLCIRQGEVVALLGPNGSGKSTILELISGRRRPTGGFVERSASLRGVAYQMQDYRQTLVPWKRAAQNLELARKLSCCSSHDDTEGRAILADLGIESSGDAYPARLSGGQAQRLALAMALVRRCPLSLFDEPFAALDILSRRTIARIVLTRLLGHSGAAVIVTHDVDDALFMADRIVVMQGRPLTVFRELDGLDREIRLAQASDFDLFDSARRDLISALAGRA